jgi:ribosome-associated protein
METIEFDLPKDQEYIELFKLLKAIQVIDSGGRAKLIIENEEVIVNEEIETRKRKKIVKGDVIEVFDTKIIIK